MEKSPFYARGTRLQRTDKAKTLLFLGGRNYFMYPVIGISCQVDYQTESEQSTWKDKRAYMHAVESAGGIPILIPLFLHFSELENLLSHLDGLLLTGGLDIQPGLYGEQKHPCLNATDLYLDAFEIALVTHALQKDLPILGICRGMQLINVLLGGTLYQDISAQCPGSLVHWRRDVTPLALVHQVMVEKGSQMEQILGTHQLAVNSLHHQAVKDPGQDIRICGWADDGIAELLEVVGHRFVLGVQSHPEKLYRDVPAFARLFQTFISVCSHSSTQPVIPFHSLQGLQTLQSAPVRGLYSLPVFEEGLTSSRGA